MKSVIISIQPKWCEWIVPGIKIVELRKTRPNNETPFKCFIYCTLDGGMEGDMIRALGGDAIVTCGKVIGEFVCDDIVEDRHGEFAGYFEQCGRVTRYEQIEYAGNKTIYGWHISNLKIYDKPLPLSAFGLKKPPQSWQYTTASPCFCRDCQYSVKVNGDKDRDEYLCVRYDETEFCNGGDYCTNGRRRNDG